MKQCAIAQYLRAEGRRQSMIVKSTAMAEIPGSGTANELERP